MLLSCLWVAPLQEVPGLHLLSVLASMVDASRGGAPAMVGALWDVLGGDLEQLVCSLLKGWNTRPLRHTRSACKDKDGDSNSLLGALVKAREACKLRFLTGAAVVCYGIPL